MFESIIASSADITTTEFIICSLISLGFGIVIAFLHSFKNAYSGNMLLTLVLLPVIVQTIIMLVNGNIGAGIAVMGAFSLVRFRSIQGNSREIASIFLATTVGLAMAMGFVGYAAVLVVLVGVIIIAVQLTGICDSTLGKKQLKVVIPENLDYEGLIDDLLDEYTTRWELTRVKTTNMGSLFELSYDITMKKGVSEKKFIDAIRCRNGNLTIICGRATTPKEEL